MSFRDFMKASRPGNQDSATRCRGGHRGSGYATKGNAGHRSNWGNIVAPYGRPFRGGYSGFRRMQGRRLPTKENALCSLCGTGEGRYKFRCCGRHFCSTMCYKQHTESPCRGPPAQEVQPHLADASRATGSSKTALHILSESSEGPTLEAAVPLAGPTFAEEFESSLDLIQPSNELVSAADAPGIPLSERERGFSSANSDAESGEASSDESDVSQNDKSQKRSDAQRRRASERSFASLSAKEREIIKGLFTRPEMQKAAVREAICSAVVAGSHGLGAGSAALSGLMKNPDFAAFADSFLASLEPKECLSKEVTAMCP